MIVAVALGLLGPAALENDDDETSERSVQAAPRSPVDGPCADAPSTCERPADK